MTDNYFIVSWDLKLANGKRSRAFDAFFFVSSDLASINDAHQKAEEVRRCVIDRYPRIAVYKTVLRGGPWNSYGCVS